MPKYKVISRVWDSKKDKYYEAGDTISLAAERGNPLVECGVLESPDGANEVDEQVLELEPEIEPEVESDEGSEYN
jgi:hypothetical protein